MLSTHQRCTGPGLELLSSSYKDSKASNTGEPCLMHSPKGSTSVSILASLLLSLGSLERRWGVPVSRGMFFLSCYDLLASKSFQSEVGLGHPGGTMTSPPKALKIAPACVCKM